MCLRLLDTYASKMGQQGAPNGSFHHNTLKEVQNWQEICPQVNQESGGVHKICRHLM